MAPTFTPIWGTGTSDQGRELKRRQIRIGTQRRPSRLRQHLSRLFVRHTGGGIAAYRRALRTGQVLDRRVDGEGTLADLAAACGFTDHAHLTHVIRTRFGVTPSALRAELAEQPPGTP